ncbi:hypothetical protein BD560DRAFT_350050 [Blakeslea trispora]|nr:hypothetical protein BD560DRAFT_350050 [Blakeslea trispora]
MYTSQYSNHTRPPRHNQRDTNLATQWTSWANDQVQQHPDHSAVDSLPERLHRSNAPDHSDRASSTSSVSSVSSVSFSPLASTRHTPSLTESKSKNRQAIMPTKDQLDIILPETPLCFCHKPAHRAYTLEYGPILECNSFNTAPTAEPSELNRLRRKFVCGFHVHELSWNVFCDRIRQGHTIYAEHPELKTCSLYNFTYCAMFRVTNSYSVHPPIALPQCFCQRPVAMRVHPRDGLQLACKNSNIDGARKCSWVLKASDVAFPRPKFDLHTYVSHDYYVQQKQLILQDIRKEENEKKENEKKENEKKEERTDEKESHQQHKFDLLAALSASSTGSFFHPNTEEKSRFEPNEVIDFDQLAMQEKERQQQTLIVPTCVMAKKPKSATPTLLSMSTSSSTSSASSVNNESFTLSSEYQSALKEIAELKQAIVNEQKTKNTVLEETKKIKAEYNKIKLQLSREELLNYRLQSMKEEQGVLLRNCQEKIQKMELSVIDIVNEKVILQEELSAMIEEKENSPSKEDDKHSCILCFTQPIEFCLIPCYHYAFCQECSIKLTECPICRTTIKRAQKIFAP